MNLTKLALKRPVSTMLVVLALVVFGITSLFGFRLELQPDMEMPMLLVLTTYPGADPESVEELVTKEVESAGAEMSGVDTYTSMSSENVSMVMFSYDYGIDIDEAYMDLRTALDTVAAQLPEDAQDPYIMELSMDAADTVTISATAVGDVDLLSYVENTAVPELETLLGVADVTVTGGKENYIKVELNPEAMRNYGLSMSGVAQSIAALDFTIPAGSVSQGTQDVTVSSSADISGIVQIQNIPVVTAKGSVIPLSDIAAVSESQRAATSISRYNGAENITIGVAKNQSYGTVNVARDVEKVVDRLQAANSAVDLQITYNASDMILSSLGSVAQTLVIGVVLSMFVLFLFFGDFKASLIVGSSMPVSLFATMILMNAMGFSFNIVTTGALVIAIGMMVDSSIVVIESCFRLKDMHGDYKMAAAEGTRIVTASIIASTITTVVVYLPLSTMKGLSGQMFEQLGFTIIFALIASLIVAMTLIPLFFYKFRPSEKKELPINALLRGINNSYDKLLRKLLYKKKTVLAAAVLLLIIAFGLLTQVHMELMPQVDESTISITAQFRSGTRLEKVEEQSIFLEEKVAADPNVENYNIRISDNTATVTAYLSDACELSTAQVVEQYTRDLANVTNMDITVASSGSNMTSMMSGSVEVDLSGRDLDDLKAEAKRVEELMRSTPGVLKVSSDIGEASTKAEVMVDPLKSMSVGLAPAQVAMEMYYALSGTEAVTLSKSGEEYSVRLEYPEGQYEDMNALMNMTLTTGYQKQIPLSELAEVVYTDAPESLTRVDGIYQVAITASTTESAKFTADETIKAAVAEMDFVQGVTVSENMMTEMMNEEFSAIITAIFTAVFLVFLVMAMQFESPRFSAMVMLSIPFSLIGSFFLLFATGSTLSMVSLMGILMLVGIVVNNGILYVDTANQLREEMFVEEALIQSGQIRLRPILMTTLTTILSMLPLSLGIGDGGVLMQGMALVIIGGLIASTLLILLLLPTFYLIIYEGRGKKLKRKKLREQNKAAQREKREQPSLEETEPLDQTNQSSTVEQTAVEEDGQEKEERAFQKELRRAEHKPQKARPQEDAWEPEEADEEAEAERDAWEQLDKDV